MSFIWHHYSFTSIDICRSHSILSLPTCLWYLLRCVSCRQRRLRSHFQVPRQQTITHTMSISVFLPFNSARSCMISELDLGAYSQYIYFIFMSQNPLDSFLSKSLPLWDSLRYNSNVLSAERRVPSWKQEQPWFLLTYKCGSCWLGVSSSHHSPIRVPWWLPLLVSILSFFMLSVSICIISHSRSLLSLPGLWAFPQLLLALKFFVMYLTLISSQSFFLGHRDFLV